MTNIDKKIVEKLKKKLAKINIELENEEIDEYLHETRQKILNYCHIKEVQIGLMYTWLNMTVDLIRYNNDLGKSANEEDGELKLIGAITSISEGDTALSINPNAKTDTSKERTMNIYDQLLFNYIEELNTFRRIKW